MNETDRVWAELTDEERAALRRGECLPRARRDGPVVRDVSAEAQRVFDEVRDAGGRMPVVGIKTGRSREWQGKPVEAAIAELVKRGLLRQCTVSGEANTLAGNSVSNIFTFGLRGTVDAVEVVPAFEHALLVDKVRRGRPGSRAA